MSNKKIRFGIVGTNFITDHILEAGAKDSRFEATALYSRTAERAAEFGDKYGIAHRFTSYEAMLDSGLIDAVYIASPNYLHAEHSILAMRHGKHVLCEKPLAGNAREVKQMIDAAKENNVLLMEAMKTTLSPGFGAVRDNLHRIGTIRRYVASYCQYSSRYDKLKEGIVLNAFKPELSNGALLDIGVYTLYPLIALFGKPQSVQASGILLPTGVDGQGSALLRYGEADAVIFYSKIADSMLPSEIEGEDGYIRIDRINMFREVTLTTRAGATETLWQTSGEDDYVYEIKAFIDLIAEGKTESPINSFAASLATAEVMDEIRRQVGVRYPADGEG